MKNQEPTFLWRSLKCKGKPSDICRMFHSIPKYQIPLNCVTVWGLLPASDQAASWRIDMDRFFSYARIKVKLCLRVEDTSASFLPLTSMLSMSLLPELLLFSWVICSNSALILPAGVFQIKDLFYFIFYQASTVTVQLHSFCYDSHLSYVLLSLCRCLDVISLHFYLKL